MIHVNVVYSYDHLEVFLNEIIECEIIAITQNGGYYTVVYKEK